MNFVFIDDLYTTQTRCDIFLKESDTNAWSRCTVWTVTLRRLNYAFLSVLFLFTGAISTRQA